jgi:hypothetical protein
VVSGQLADQLDRVLGGAVALGSAAVEPHLELRAGDALPDDLELGASLRLVHHHDHLADERAHEFLSVAGGGRLGLPELRQLASETAECAALLRRERLRPPAFELRERAPLGFARGQRLLKVRLERVCHQPVLGLAGVELASGALDLELRPLEREPLTAEPLGVLTLELADRLRRRTIERLLSASVTCRLQRALL